MATFVSSPFPVEALRAAYERADVELHGVDLAVPSYEARIFLNNPDANEGTAREEANGYLGSFFVFGKHECWGEEGHCDVPTRRSFDRRRDPTRFAKVRVVIPQGRLPRLLDQAEEDQASLSIVVALADSPDSQPSDPSDALVFDRIAMITYA